MNKKDFLFLKFLILLLFSFFVMLCFSCADTEPGISSLHSTLIYDYYSNDESPKMRLSVFISPSQDIRRAKSISVSNSMNGLSWKIENPKISTYENKNYFGYSSLVMPEEKNFSEGLYDVTFFDVADRSVTDSFNLVTLKSMTNSDNSFVKVSDVISRKAGTECTHQKIILFDEIGKELFFGFYSSKLDSDEKILNIFPDAVTKRICFSMPNNSVVILLPEEKINKQ